MLDVSDGLADAVLPVSELRLLAVGSSAPLLSVLPDAGVLSAGLFPAVVCVAVVVVVVVEVCSTGWFLL